MHTNRLNCQLSLCERIRKQRLNYKLSLLRIYPNRGRRIMISISVGYVSVNNHLYVFKRNYHHVDSFK
jgi:hypothetical protein